jgi:hypothetical protein
MTPPRAAPADDIMVHVDNVRKDARARGGDVYLDPKTKQPEVQDGRLVIRSTSNPRQVLGYAPLPAKKEQGTGLFPGNSVEANALNQLVTRGILSEQQALELAAGKTITNPSTGQVEFKRPTDLVGDGALTPPKQMTEGQANAGLYADRIRNSEPIILKFSEAGTDPVTKGLSKVPVAGNYLVGEDFQRYDQAQRDFINAVLRRESGAVISDEEFANARLQYFPQPGDGKDTLKQKAENRRIVLEGISRAAGPAYKASEPKSSLGDADREKLLFEARKAIEQGAPRDAVLKRLKEKGVEGGL